MLSRLRKLVFSIQHRAPAVRFTESIRRVNRLARLMSMMQRRPLRKVEQG